MHVTNSVLREKRRIGAFGEVAQRKVFTTPVRNEADDESVTNIIPLDRGMNKVRGCAAVSIGEECRQSNRRSWPNDFPSESGPCVKTMLSDRTITERYCAGARQGRSLGCSQTYS